MLVAVASFSTAGAAGATQVGDTRAERDEARRRQAALAADLDVLEATEAELDGAAAALAAEVAAQRASVESSQQAVAAATSEIARAERELAGARAEIAALRAELVDRAVDDFITPERASIYDVAVSDDVGEARRKQAFIDHVVADGADVVDQLASAEEDIEVQEASARTAASLAEQRRGETTRRLGQLEATAAEQDRLLAAMADRQAEVVAEIDALQANEAELTALIEQREREQREREQLERDEAERVVVAASAEQRQAAAQAAAEPAPPADTSGGVAQDPSTGRATAPTPPPSTTSPTRTSPTTPSTPTRPTSGTTAAPRPTTPAPGPTTTLAPATTVAPTTTVPPAAPAASSGGCGWPASGTVTSEFGRRWGRLHAGIDISAPIGTPIYAARAGTVLVAGSQSGYGTTVVIDHGEMTTLYGHQSRLATSVGASVARGELIGYVGNTGRSTGPHLHFETRVGGSPRNPRSCLG